MRVKGWEKIFQAIRKLAKASRSSYTYIRKKKTKNTEFKLKMVTRQRISLFNDKRTNFMKNIS